MNFPIDITEKDPSTFSYTPEELGVTPITSTVVKLPIDTDWKESEGELLPIGSQQSIWIGKNASLDLILGSSNYTSRHEIRALAFEDGRTDLVKDVTVNWVDTHYRPYDSQDDEAYVDAQTAAGEAAYNTAYDAWYEEHEAWQAAYDAWEAGTSEEDPGEEPVEPNWDDYTYNKFFDTWDRNTREFIYNQKTLNDLSKDPYVTSPEPLPSWNYRTSISKSLRLPEGITSFGQFSFRHTHFDKTDDHDNYFHNPTDFRIFIPSTVTAFTVFGIVNDYNDPKNDVDEDSNEDNTLYFGEFANMSNPPIWMGDTEDDGYPLNENSTHSEIEEYYQEHDHDTVHIYLRDHTTVPKIVFYGKIYFPIVFHVNDTIKDAFKQKYQELINLKYTNNYGRVVTLDYDPVSVIVDVGSQESTSTQTLKETVFSSVSQSGSYNDLKDKPSVTVSYIRNNLPETINFAEVNPGTGHSSDIITSYV